RISRGEIALQLRQFALDRVEHQDVYPGKIEVPARGFFGRDVTGEAHDESRAFVGTALRADGAAHDRGKLAANGQSQTGAAEAPGCRVFALHKRIKQALQCLRTHADAVVLDAYLDGDLVVG